MSPDLWGVGWDIGGAHLKVALADPAGSLKSVDLRYTPLWQGLDCLDPVLEQLVKGLPVGAATHAVTMTGELVDLFSCREQGVSALSERICAHLPGQRVYVYAGPKGFVRSEVAAANADLVASANWHATARLASEHFTEAVVVDIGSTTADLIPIVDGQVRSLGYSDRERLARQELIYTGVVRTPVMSLAKRAPFAGEWVELAAELFATTADIFRLTGELPEHADLGATADGRGKGEAESAARLARMIGEDAAGHPLNAWRGLARYFRDCQLERLSEALARQCSLGLADDAPLIGAGVGRFLVRRLAQRLERPYLDISTLFYGDATGFHAGAADCAPAAALALLAKGLTDATID